MYEQVYELIERGGTSRSWPHHELAFEVDGHLGKHEGNTKF